MIFWIIWAKNFPSWQIIPITGCLIGMYFFWFFSVLDINLRKSVKIFKSLHFETLILSKITLIECSKINSEIIFSNVSFGILSGFGRLLYSSSQGYISVNGYVFVKAGLDSYFWFEKIKQWPKNTFHLKKLPSTVLIRRTI